jgi:O-antigen/teichoic acid export membrane protein
VTLPFKRLFKDVLIYGAGDILLRATAFITIPIYTRIFHPADYGIWSFVITLVGLLSSVLILGGDSAYARFFFAARSDEEKRVITSSWLGFLTLWSAGICLVLLPLSSLFSHWSFGTGHYAILFMLALASAPITLMGSMCGQVLRNQFRPRMFTALNVATTLLSVAASLFGAVILGLGLTGVLGGALAAACLMLPIRLWTVRQMITRTFSWPAIRNLLKFGIPLVPVSIAYWVFASSDRFVLDKLSTLDQLGLYAVANSTTTVLAFINSAFGQAWSPYSIRVFEEQPEVAPAFYGQVMTYLLVGFGLLCVIVTAFSYELLVIISTRKFYGSAVAVGPLALGFMAYATTQITGLSLSLSKRTNYFVAFAWPAAVLNVVLNLIFVPAWGMLASAWATMAAYVFLTVGYYVVSQRLLPVAYEGRRAVLAIVATVAFTIGASFLPVHSLVLSLIIKSSYCLAYVVVLIILGVVDSREWVALRSVWHAVRLHGVEAA